jgi:hypothetical protein
MKHDNPGTIDQDLRDVILEASEALDPDHQDDHWPDPIAWDGRPLIEQAEDILVLAESRHEQSADDLERPLFVALAAKLRDACRKSERAKWLSDPDHLLVSM